MNISTYRSSFVIYVVDSTATNLRTIQETLQEAGYTVKYFVTHEDVMASIETEPPHILFCSGEDEMLFGGPFDLWFRNIKEILPELHLILTTPAEKLQEFSLYLNQGLYDLVTTPVIDRTVLLRSADRAAECDYYMYMNEQLKDEVEVKVPIAESSLSVLEIWMDQMLKANSYESAIGLYLKEVSRYLKGAAIIYLKYIPGYESLIVSQSEGFELKNLSGVGIQLADEEKNFNVEALKNPEQLGSLKKLIKEGFLQDHFSAYPLYSGERVAGVFIIFSLPEHELNFEHLHDPHIRVCLKALSSTYKQLDLEKKIHLLSSFDEKTHVLNRQHTLKRINEEVSRARRTSLPVSFMIISIDSFRDLTIGKDKEAGDRILKNVAGVIEQNSRVNDIVGRLGSDEFGVLLPHTGSKGGAVKAERLRRIIETADFSKVLSEGQKITVSIGLSEYPSVCQDADELMQTADEALYQIKKVGRNKVCLAKAPENFSPDFEAKDY